MNRSVLAKAGILLLLTIATGLSVGLAADAFRGDSPANPSVVLDNAQSLTSAQTTSGTVASAGSDAPLVPDPLDNANVAQQDLEGSTGEIEYEYDDEEYGDDYEGEDEEYDDDEDSFSISAWWGHEDD